MFDNGNAIEYNITRVIARCTMRLNVNRILHTPGASQDFHFEMDLSDLDFGGMYPVVHPVVVDGRVMNRAGVLHCELQAETTLRSVCARCAKEFDDPQTVAFGTAFLKIRCFAPAFMFLSFHIVHFMQAVGQGKTSLCLALIRQLGLNIPLLFLLDHLFGMTGIVWTQTLADFVNVIISCIIFTNVCRKIRTHMAS